VNSVQEKPVIVIAAGGTGGHIFPAIATGAKLKELMPAASIIYACGERPLEIGLYERNQIKPVVFPAKQLRGGIAGKLGGVTAAAGNIWRAFRWLKGIKADIVIGFGGYVSGPTVLAGKFAGCKTAIHEANSVPGKTNRILGSLMNLTATHFEATLKKMGGNNKVALGMPIRPLESAASKEEARQVFGLEPDVETLLILGGSQGAKFLYESLMDKLSVIDARRDEPLQILWSTGEAHLDSLQVRLDSLVFENLSIKLVPFISDMGNALKAADVAIARAGASALAELVSYGVYTIYVPYPAAIYDHQTLNAREAEKVGAGVVVKESDVPMSIADEVVKAFNQVRNQHELVIPAYLDSAKAAERLADEVRKLL